MKINFTFTVREGIKAFDLKSKRKVWSTSFKKDNVNARVWSGFSFVKKQILYLSLQIFLEALLGKIDLVMIFLQFNFFRL